MNKQNIILILTDQHRFDTVGANGSSICRTPFLDKLASTGLNFQQAYSVCGLCTPARASIYTGKLPHNHGLTRNVMEDIPNPASIPAGIPTLAERIGQRGYKSYFVGKWHAGKRLPTECGFEGMDVPGYGDIRNYKGYLDYLKRRGLERPSIIPIGAGWAHNLILAGKTTGPIEASVQYFLAEYAIEALKKCKEASQPFFIALNFWGPHAPYLPCEPYASMYDPKTIPPWGNFNDTFKNKPPIYQRYRDAFIGQGSEQRTWEECARWAALYFGFVTQIDAQIGRVFKAMEEYGLEENTAVIFSTDHGDLTGAHGGMHDKGGIICQEVYHIPLIARIAGQKNKGSRNQLLVSNLDIASTVLEIAGCKMSDEIDGRSLLPILKGEVPSDWPDYVVAEFFGHHYAYEARMVVHKGFKYIFHPGGFDELYNLKNDPWELNNLIDSSDHKDVLREIKYRLLKWAKKTGDELTVLCGLFEQRETRSVENLAPYGIRAMDALRQKEPKPLPSGQAPF